MNTTIYYILGYILIVLLLAGYIASLIVRSLRGRK
jgi:hypothetical protein